MRNAKASYEQAFVPWNPKILKIENNMILSLVTSKTIRFHEFPSLARISLFCADRFAYYYVPRYTVLPNSHTGIKMIGRFHAENCFYKFGMLNLECCEICKFVWSNRISLMVFSHMACDSSCQIAKQMRNAGTSCEQSFLK